MLSLLQEKHTHGTTTFPLQVYSHHDKDGFYSVPQHWHDELEWLYVETGILCLTVHGKSFELHPGQFCFINSGELHEIKSTGESYHHAVVFQAKFLDFELYDTCQHQFIGPVTSRRLTFPTLADALPPDTARAVLGHLQAIAALYHAPEPTAPLAIKIHILQILELLYRFDALTEDAPSPKEAENLTKLKTVISYLHEHYREPLTLQKLADLAYLSPTYFCHYFRKQTGKSPITFLNEYRIEQAARLLTSSSLSVSQIAVSVGFDNFSYFIRKFRACKHVSPTEYRRQLTHRNP